jgi:hypothetical protein
VLQCGLLGLRPHWRLQRLILLQLWQCLALQQPELPWTLQLAFLDLGHCLMLLGPEPELLASMLWPQGPSMLSDRCSWYIVFRVGTSIVGTAHVCLDGIVLLVIRHGGACGHVKAQQAIPDC